MNKIILMGRLTRDPEVRYTQSDKSTAIARYSLAVDRRFKTEGGDNADFIPCVAFGKQGEFAEKYLTKGMKILVVGRIQVRKWEDSNGDKRTTTEAVVEEHYFCSQRNDAASMTSDHVTRSVAGAEECGGMQRTALAGTESKNGDRTVSQAMKEQKQDFYPVDDDDEDLPF